MIRLRRAIRAFLEAWRDPRYNLLRITPEHHAHLSMNCQMGSWPHFGACMRGSLR